ncbi:MAG: DUF2079 domain-containing protein [Chloroflexota bacterium]|nr:DUF2079 domain-containing protein [Chloroflexota bacterium]
MNPADRLPWQRMLLAAAVFALVVLSWFTLTPQRWLGTLVPAGTPATEFNLSLLSEVRISLAFLAAALIALLLLRQPLSRVAGWLAGYLVRLDDWLAQGKRTLIIIVAMVIGSTLILAAFSIARHQAFNSKAYDLGLHSQVFWNTSQGRPFASSVEVENYLGDHVSPIILILAPIYWLWPDPRALLILQAAALALAAIPLVALARQILTPLWPRGSRVSSLVLAALFLTYPALGFVNRFEFHEEVLVVPLLLLAFWALEAERPGILCVSLFLSLLCKEDIGLTVAAFGLFVWWRKRPYRSLGIGWTIAGLLWSLLALFFVIPLFRSAPSDTLARYAWLGASPADIVSGLIRNPELLLSHTVSDPRRLWMLFKFLLPVGFLSLLSPAILVALPSLAINWLAGNLYQSSIYFHYAAPLIAIVFAAAVYGMAATRRFLRFEAAEQAPASPGFADRIPQVASSPRYSWLVLVLSWMIACALLAGLFDQFWQADAGPSDWENYSLQGQIEGEHFWQAEKLLPVDGSVATTEAYAPHLANRQDLYLLHDPRILRIADRVDWVLVDLNDHRYGVQPRLYYGLMRWITEERDLDVCYFDGDVVLLGPGCNNPGALTRFESRLQSLQLGAAGEELDPALVEYLGSQFFP